MVDWTSGYQSIMNAGKVAAVLLLFLILAVSMTFIAIMLAKHAKKTKIIEINQQTKKVQMYSGGEKKSKSGIRNFFAPKMRRILPQLQQADYYSKGKGDAVILLKDNNGLYHTLRVPSYEDIREWYAVIHRIDISDKEQLVPISDEKSKKKKFVQQQRIKDIYFMPTPHEDLDWLARQIKEADTEFKFDRWWQHPNVMVVGTAFVCCMMIVFTVVFRNGL